MITVQARNAFTENLNRASATKRCYPWDDDVIDWSVPIDDEHLYVPEEFTFLAGTPLWDRLTVAEKSFVTRWEATQNLRNAGAGEHLLNQALLALLHHTDPYDPGWRYMLHEVAEECQHMAMFNAWIRLNPDIRTKGIGDDRWGLFASVMTPVLATNLPVFFWMMTMLLEVFGDEVARVQARNESGLLHPILQQMGRAHLLEETRHIAFARDWIARARPRMSRTHKILLSETAERAISVILRTGIPLPYSRQIEPHVSYDEFRTALRSDHRKATIQRQILPTIRELQELRVVRDAAVTRWERRGLLPAASA